MKYDVTKTIEQNVEALGATLTESEGTWLLCAGKGAKLFTDKQEMIDTVMGFFDAC